jgi:hypothetical protein
MGNGMGNSKNGSTEKTRWLSYAELAEVRVISKRAAIRLANRHQWGREKGDGGMIRVAVPASELHREPDGIFATVPTNQDGVHHARAIRAEARVQELTAQLDVTRTQMIDLRLRESMARSQAEALQAEVKRLKALLENGLLERLQGVWRRISVVAWIVRFSRHAQEEQHAEG